MDEEHRYWTYLVRFWPVRQGGALVWRASALEVHSGQQEMFAEPSMLLDFLEDVVRRLPLDDEAMSASEQGDSGVQIGDVEKQ